MPEPSMVARGRRAATTPLVLAALAAAVAGCEDSAASGAAAAAGAADSERVARTVVAVVDFSGSQTSHAVRESREYLETVVEELSFGDRLVLLEMYRSGPRDSVGRFVQEMPEPIRPGAITSYDRRELEAARRGVLNALPIFFDPKLVRTVATTDLLTTFHMASEHLHDAGADEKELLILSDMLQSTPEFEFEGGRRMPPSGWLQAQEERDLLPPLDGACVVVIGADDTTPHGRRVRAFWQAYFEAAGATLPASNYRLRAPPDVVAC